jgi:hypothetical protein
LGEVQVFLCSVFGVSKGYRMFQPDLLRWKCLAAHPFWEGSRGYVLRYKGQIASFGCVVPCRFITGSGTVSSCDVIDWAASKTVPGAGIMLYRHIQGLAGTMINIGGTADARNVLPKIGFQERLERHTYARVLRPWRQFQTAPQKDWKSPLRLARDYTDLARKARIPGDTPTVRRVNQFAGLPPEALPEATATGQIVCAATPESLDYFLGYPAAPVEAYVLEREQRPQGYFLLSRVATQCRIAGLWIRSADQNGWAAAYASATATAQADPNTTEITTAASGALQTDALNLAGYRHAQSEPVFVLDPARKLEGRSDLALSFLENDSFYWSAHVR